MYLHDAHLDTNPGVDGRAGWDRLAAGLALFALSSAACALAPDVAVLLAARVAQGAGAALIMPLALALLNAAFPPQQRGWAMGLYGSLTGLGTVLGPVLGGALTQVLSRWPFPR
ncbi:MAG TPA: MFS transporter [Streptosporangiaceae bacterium]|jgi:MFS family permease